MKELWTPWRMTYILAARNPGGCIFCEKPREPGHHQYILRRGHRTFTILNLYPYAVGHVMVVPYRHLPRLAALTSEERREVAEELARAERVLRRVAGIRSFHAGINLGRAAGAGVDGHLHAHLVPTEAPPSWSGEGQRGDDLPVPIDATYERLRPAFD